MAVSKSKHMSAEQAAELVKDGDWVAVDGFVGSQYPEELVLALEERFLKTGHPCNLTILGFGTGNRRGKGFDHFAHEGMIERAIIPYANLTPDVNKLILDDKIEAYMVPGGVLSQWVREIGAGRPGLITFTGLETFVDPRLGGGKMNEITKTDLVELVKFDGREYLRYKPIPVNVALVRGTTADEFGNTTVEREALINNVLQFSQAAKACNGKVFVQVERIAQRGTLYPKDVKVPGIYVDGIVISKPENHWQTYRTQYNPAYSGEVRVSLEAGLPPLPKDWRMVVGKRGALELRPGYILNFGVGSPEFVAEVAGYEGVSEYVHMTVEPGPIGGVPAYGIEFGASTNPEVIIDMPSQFDYYDGTGTDLTYVGIAQTDRFGNLNVSKLKGHVTGIGGFMNVTQNAKKVVFIGSFTYGLEVELKEGTIKIIKDGPKKFINDLEQITFSGDIARKKEQKALIVTERAVFELGEEGWKLIEIAPGIDLQREVLDKMEWRPIIADDLKEMPRGVFIAEDRSLHLKEKFDNMLSEA